VVTALTPSGSDAMQEAGGNLHFLKEKAVHKSAR
jgi:hypothetical protein